MAVSAYESTDAMARAAAGEAAEVITSTILRRGEANLLVSGAESQQSFHRALANESVDWLKVRAFTVDEFVAPGLPAQCAVAAQPARDLFKQVPVGEVHAPDYSAPAEEERARYEALIEKYPPDLACVGIGVSGHVALNEPHDTDFADPQHVRIVRLCNDSVEQLEQDMNFCALDAIPRKGITLTMPAIMQARHVLVVAPYAIKAPIIARMLQSDVSRAIPATLLRTHPSAHLYLDDASSARINWDVVETDDD